MDFDDIFLNRNYDFCETEKHFLAEYSGISRPSLYSGLKDLSEKNLIEENETGWDVYLRSKGLIIFKRSFLNSKIAQCKKTTGHAVKKKSQNVKKRPKSVKKLPAK